MMIKGIILVGVGRNLNRAVRICYSFGVYDVYCLNCFGQVKGNLFSASGRVKLHNIKNIKDITGSILGLEVTKSLPALQDYPVQDIEYLAVGGESVTLRQSDFPRMARIPTKNSLCLTTEAALAIALYDIMRRVPK